MSDAVPRPGIDPELRQTSASDGTPRVELTGAWNLRSLERNLAVIAPRLAECAGDRGRYWDLSGVTALDHAGAMLLWRAWGRRRAEHVSLRPEHETLFAHLDLPPEPAKLPARRGPVEQLVASGSKVLMLLEHLVYAVVLLGRVALVIPGLMRNPSRIPWRDISANIYRTGAQALSITALVGFLVGVVLSYLTAQQLRVFGADVFIINLLGVSVIRELGPVLAAILVAGRSGSAMTAQLGVMRVTEELDAMNVMGISHTLRLVLPKMVALAITMPLLILWTDAVALLGGMVSAKAQLGIGYHFFMSSLPDAVPIANLWLGLGKGIVFGILIGLIACHFGLRIEPNTVSLGAGTTNSVVTAITMVIIVDAIFAVMFSDVGSF
jgi:phospholipid/cholesterol/gamma-HCH transport system permease protein